MIYSPEYIAWYSASRCKDRNDLGIQCNQDKEIIVDKDLPSVEVSLERNSKGIVTRSTMTKPSHTLNYCYYHNEKEKGSFDFVKEKR